jgi:hypothetical protein
MLIDPLTGGQIQNLPHYLQAMVDGSRPQSSTSAILNIGLQRPHVQLVQDNLPNEGAQPIQTDGILSDTPLIGLVPDVMFRCGIERSFRANPVHGCFSNFLNPTS